MFLLDKDDAAVLQSDVQLNQIGRRRRAALYFPRMNGEGTPGVFSPLHHWDVMPPVLLRAFRTDVGADSRIIRYGKRGDPMRENVWALIEGGRVLVTPAVLSLDGIDGRTAKDATMVNMKLAGRPTGALEFKNVSFLNCRFVNAQWDYVRWIECTFVGCTFEDCILREVSFVGGDLSQTIWKNNEIRNSTVGNDVRTLNIKVQSGQSVFPSIPNKELKAHPQLYITEFDFTPESYGFDESEEVPVEVPAGSVVFFNGYLLHRSRKNNADIYRRVLVSHYMNAWSLLPWHAQEGVGMAKTDVRRIVPVAGIDPYAWKGVTQPKKEVWLRTCKANEKKEE